MQNVGRQEIRIASGFCTAARRGRIRQGSSTLSLMLSTQPMYTVLVMLPKIVIFTCFCSRLAGICRSVVQTCDPALLSGLPQAYLENDSKQLLVPNAHVLAMLLLLRSGVAWPQGNGESLKWGSTFGNSSACLDP